MTTGFSRILALTVAAALIFSLGACGDPAKQDILKKAEKAATKAELEKALGKPTEVSKVGPVEKWSYKAKDGVVVFMIAGDKVTLSGAN